MMNSKAEESIIYRPSEEQLNNSQPTKGIYIYRGPITPERTKQLRDMYEEAGWLHDPLPTVLSFVSPCGRWFDCYDTATSQFYRIDGEWKVNLVQTKHKEEDGKHGIV